MTPDIVGESAKLLVPVPPATVKAVELSARPAVVVMDWEPEIVIAGLIVILIDVVELTFA